MAAAAEALEKAEREQYAQYKRLIPYLYDWFANHSLPWPSLTCRWGPVLDETANRRRQKLYLSEQTDGSEANKLVVAAADVLKPRVAAAEQLQAWNEYAKSNCVSSKPLKVIIHPGEVNKVRELPQHPSVVVTHTDAPQLYVWNTESQPHRNAEKGAKDARLPSMADLTLEGHEDDAEFALGLCNAAPLVASGGRDRKVLVWNLSDHATSLAATAPAAGSPSVTNGSSKRSSTTLQPQVRLTGHSKTVEDVCFLPGSVNELASCADDSSILFWDLRAAGASTGAFKAAHGKQDVHCLDWSPHRAELVVTGAADGSVRIWDRRRQGSTPLHTLFHHTAATICVEWSPHRAGVFASGSEDRLLCVWDALAPAPHADSAAAKRHRGSAVPHQLMFQHCGHRSPVVDLHWNPHDPWALVSASDEAGEGGGGTVQMWRMSDLIYRPDDEILAELEQYREFIITGQESALRKAQQQQQQREGSRPPADAVTGGPAGTGTTLGNSGSAFFERGGTEGAEPGQEGTSGPAPADDGRLLQVPPAAAAAAAPGSRTAAAEDGASPMEET